MADVKEEVKDALQSAGQKLDDKLSDAKKQWEEEAKVDPTTARRKLRTFWVGVSVVAFLLGGAAGHFLTGLF